MRKLLVNASNSITGGQKKKLPSLYSAKRRKPALSCTYYVQKCLYIESDPVSRRCLSVGISFAKELQRASQPTDPPAFPRNSCCLAYSFSLWSLKRVHRGATGSDFPSHLLLQKKKRVLSSPLKTLQTELDHKQTHLTHKMYAHKDRHLPNSWN